MLKYKFFIYYRDPLIHKYGYIVRTGISFSIFCLSILGYKLFKEQHLFSVCALPTVMGPTLSQNLHVLRMYLACR